MKNILHYSKNCYYIEEQRYQFEEAENQCYDKGPLAKQGGYKISHLVKMDSGALHSALKSTVKRWYSWENDTKPENELGYWIGVKRQGNISNQVSYVLILYVSITYINYLMNEK